MRDNQHIDERPTPDPTILTTEQLMRQTLGLREIIEARINGMDKAIALLQAQVDKSPTIAEVFAKFNEKFNSIQTQFNERDIRTDQTSRDSKVAVDAALQAAKEAVGEQNKSSALAIAKSEAATMKQMDQLNIMLDSSRRGLDDKISDIKERLTGLDGRHRGMGEIWGYVIGVAGLLVAFAVLILKVYK